MGDSKDHSNGSLEARTRSLDLATSLLSVALVGGFYIDLWAHSHGRVDETFLTPWHGILYASAGLMGGFLLYHFLRGRREGHTWKEALPFGYGLSIIGAGLFLAGGVGDLAWHEVFGFEDEVEDLLSPTHLVLATSGLFMISGPLRSSWRRGGRHSFPSWLVWVLPLTMMFSIFTAFTSYAHPAVDAWPAEAPESDAEISRLAVTDLATGRQTRLEPEITGPVWLPAALPDGSLVVSSSFEGQGSLHVIATDGTARTIWEGEGVFHHPNVSPDGSMIAFNADVEGWSEIFVVPTDGGEATRLTDSESHDWGPAWSPGGETIVFASSRDGDEDLWIIGIDGSEPTQLTNLEGTEVSPDWSPDGSLIVFEHNPGDNIDVYTITPDGSELTRLTSDPGLDISPAWAPDGSRIAFSSNRVFDLDIYSMAADGSDLRVMSVNPTSDEGWAGITWSGDSVVSNTSGWEPFWVARGNRDVRAVTSMLIQAALITGVLLVALRHGRLPFGSVTVLMTVNGALMTVFSDNYWYVIPAAVAGLVGDVFLVAFRSAAVRTRLRTALFALLVVWYGGYLVAVAVTQGGLGWRIHMVAGTPLLAGAIGLLMSLVVFPGRGTDASSVVEMSESD